MNYQAAGRLLFSQLEEEGNLGLLCGPIVVFLLAICRSKPFGSAPTVPCPAALPCSRLFLLLVCFSPEASLADPPPPFLSGSWELTAVNQLKRLFAKKGAGSDSSS